MQYTKLLTRPGRKFSSVIRKAFQDLIRKARISLVFPAVVSAMAATQLHAVDLPRQIPAMPSALASKALLNASARAGDRLVAVGAYGNIVYSVPAADGKGLEWRQAKVPTQRLLTAVTFVDEREGWAGGHDALILHTTDGGENWEIQYQDPMPNGDLPKPVLGIAFSDKHNGIAVGAFSLLLTTADGGKTWTSLDAGPLYDLLEAQGQEPEPNLYSILKLGDEFLVVGELGTLLRYRPAAQSDQQWRIIKSPYQGTFFGARQLSSGDILAYGLRGHLFRSSDQGETWTRIETATLANINDVIELSANRFLAVADSGTLLTLQNQQPTVAVEKIAYPGFSNLMSVQRIADDAVILFGSMGAQPFSIGK